MTAFVILHYRAIDSTIKCVESIKALKGDNKIIIVDNASPDDTGRQLQLKYAGEEGITILMNPENSGFARGNNFGVRWAWEHFSPDFTVVLNDDVEIFQEDFSLRIQEIYDRRPFDLLGPDIVSVFSGIHQSPKRMSGYDLDAVRRKMAYVRRSSNPILLLLSSGQKNSPAVWRYFQRRSRAKQNIDSASPAEGAVLHGACVIFSRRYIERHPEPFYAKTFMYFEMEILEWLCRREGCVSIYEPSIQVQHYQYTATRLEYISILRRSKFVIKCLYQSLEAAEALMLAAEPQPAPMPQPQPEPMPQPELAFPPSYAAVMDS